MCETLRLSPNNWRVRRHDAPWVGRGRGEQAVGNAGGQMVTVHSIRAMRDTRV